MQASRQSGYGLDEGPAVSVHLNREHNVFKRIWTAIKYVFGTRCIYGDFDEVIINPNDTGRLQKVVDFLKKHQE